MTNKGKIGNPNIAEVGKKTRFEKGHRRTPNAGRPPGSPSITATLQRLLEREIDTVDLLDKDKGKCRIPVRERLGMAIIAKALNGDIPAIREILDRIEGKATAKIEVTGKDGEPIKSENAVSVSAITQRLSEFIGD